MERVSRSEESEEIPYRPPSYKGVVIRKPADRRRPSGRMPQSEEAGWDHTQRAEDGGAWSSILAPAREVFAPSAGRSSWVSGTKGGVDDADASAAEDYEVRMTLRSRERLLH